MNVMTYAAHEAVWDSLEPYAGVIHYGVSRPGLKVIGFIWWHISAKIEKR